MAFLVFFDETGNTCLDSIDNDFPVFCLCMVVCDFEQYTEQIIPSITKFKYKYFQHEGIILHSRDIRKAQGDFVILSNKSKREEFRDDLTKLINKLNFKWISAVIKKQQHVTRYGSFAQHPYELALTFCIERLIPFMEDGNQNKLSIIAEARGKKEDADLERFFLRLAYNGTNYLSKERTAKIHFQLKFVKKDKNVIGTQLADLCAYPIARWVLDPSKDIFYSAIASKQYIGRGRIRGLKIFP